MRDTMPSAILFELSHLDAISAVLAERIERGEDSEELWAECDRVTSEFDRMFEALRSPALAE